MVDWCVHVVVGMEDVVGWWLAGWCLVRCNSATLVSAAPSTFVDRTWPDVVEPPVVTSFSFATIPRGSVSLTCHHGDSAKTKW